MQSAAAWLAAVASLACAACRSDEQVIIPPDRVLVAELAPTFDRKVDLLFLIDDSGGTADLQLDLGAALPRLFDRLATLPGGMPDLHVGVTTSDLGTETTSGVFGEDVGTINQGGCSGAGRNGVLQLGQVIGVNGTFLIDRSVVRSGRRERNYTGDLSATVADMLLVGARGCGFEQPLAAIRAALDDNPANVGFRRPGAVLAVAILMDEDDCSMRDPSLLGPDTIDNPQQSFRCTRFGVTCALDGRTPDEMNQIGIKGDCGPNTDPESPIEDVALFADFLSGLEPDPRRVVVAGMFGTPYPVQVELRRINNREQPALAHSCSYGPDGAGRKVADPGVRLQAFVDHFGDRGSSDTICQDELSRPVDDLGRSISLAVGTSCVVRPLGDRPDCIVTDIDGDTVTEIPPCDGTAGTCWHLESDATSCPLDDQLRLVVDGRSASATSLVQLRCAIP